MSKLQFIVEVFRNPMVTGDILPTQRYLIRRMIDCIEISNHPLKIVEFGGGEGAITRAIVDKVERGGIGYDIFSFELNSRLADMSREKFEVNGKINGCVRIIEDDAVNMLSHLDNGIGADYIISSLPLSHFSREKSRNIFRAVKAGLKKNGVFTQYQHFPTCYSLVKEFFNDVKIRYVLANIPPAFVYTCRNIN